MSESQKSGKSIKDIFDGLGYKKPADYIALIAGIYGLIWLLADFINGMANGGLDTMLGVDVPLYGFIPGFGGIWLIDLMLFGMIAAFPLIAKICVSLNNKIKILPSLDQETSRRLVLYIAWWILIVILFVNQVFYSARIPLTLDVSSVWLYDIVFILVTLVVLQDIIPGLKSK